MTAALALLLVLFTVIAVGALMPIVGDIYRELQWQWQRARYEAGLDEWAEDIR